MPRSALLTLTYPGLSAPNTILSLRLKAAKLNLFLALSGPCLAPGRPLALPLVPGLLPPLTAAGTLACGGGLPLGGGRGLCFFPRLEGADPVERGVSLFEATDCSSSSENSMGGVVSRAATCTRV